jgi:hypothetical protein
MQVLDGKAAQGAIKRILIEAEWARIAVAYWGEEAIAQLCLSELRDKNIEIVCDVVSGGCNTKEIRALRSIFGAEAVKTQDRLHAKVWLTDKAAIIGSSNASANGLGFEGPEAGALTEANVLIRDREALEALLAWYKSNITTNSRPITEKDLRRGARQRAIVRSTRPSYEDQTLLDVARDEPEKLADRNIAVWVWKHSKRSRWADAALEAQRKLRHNSKIDCWENAEGFIPPPGGYIIDFDTSGPGKPILDGVWRLLSDEPKVRTNDGNILLAVPVRNIGDWALGSMKAWRDGALKSGAWEGDLVDFARQFL